MSFENLKVTGEVKSKETVEILEVNSNEVSVDCGNETLTFLGEIKRVLRKARVSSGAVKVDLPDGSSKIITSLDSPELKNADGSLKAAPAEAKYTPVYTGKAAQELLPHEERELEEAKEEDQGGTSTETPTEDTPSIETPSTEETA